MPKKRKNKQTPKQKRNQLIKRYFSILDSDKVAYYKNNPHNIPADGVMIQKLKEYREKNPKPYYSAPDPYFRDDLPSPTEKRGRKPKRVQGSDTEENIPDSSEPHAVSTASELSHKVTSPQSVSLTPAPALRASSEALSKQVLIRMKPSDYEIVRNKAASLGMSLSAYIRFAALNIKIDF